MNNMYNQIQAEIVQDGGDGSDYTIQRIMKIYDDAGYRTRDSHKEVLNRMKLTMLKAAATHVMSTMNNDFKVRDICTPEQFKMFNNFAKLRYHGLVTPVREKETSRRIKGRWLITRNGWDFLRGNLSLPHFVLVQNNHIQSKSPALIGLKDIYYAEEYITTHFDYFDDDNKPVGNRPGFPQPSKQVAMV